MCSFLDEIRQGNDKKKVKRPRRRRRSTNNGWESNEVQPDVDVKARGFFMEN